MRVGRSRSYPAGAVPCRAWGGSTHQRVTIRCPAPTPAEILADERPVVLPVGDLSIRRAIERTYALDALPGAAAIERIAEPWRPYRTLACRYVWRALQNEPG